MTEIVLILNYTGNLTPHAGLSEIYWEMIVLIETCQQWTLCLVRNMERKEKENWFGFQKIQWQPHRTRLLKKRNGTQTERDAVLGSVQYQNLFQDKRCCVMCHSWFKWNCVCESLMYACVCISVCACVGLCVLAAYADSLGVKYLAVLVFIMSPKAMSSFTVSIRFVCVICVCLCMCVYAFVCLSSMAPT